MKDLKSPETGLYTFGTPRGRGKPRLGTPLLVRWLKFPYVLPTVFLRLQLL